MANFILSSGLRRTSLRISDVRPNHTDARDLAELGQISHYDIGWCQICLSRFT